MQLDVLREIQAGHRAKLDAQGLQKDGKNVTDEYYDEKLESVGCARRRVRGIVPCDLQQCGKRVMKNFGPCLPGSM